MITKAGQVAKRPTKIVPKVKDLTNYIRIRPVKQSEKIFKIRPPQGTQDPIEYLARTYSPGDKNITVKPTRHIRDGKSAIVRLNSEVEVAILVDTLALKNCVVSKVDYCCSLLMTFGSTSDHGREMIKKLCEKN